MLKFLVCYCYLNKKADNNIKPLICFKRQIILRRILV